MNDAHVGRCDRTANRLSAERSFPEGTGFAYARPHERDAVRRYWSFRISKSMRPLGMPERLVKVGEIEVQLPEFATGETVSMDGNFHSLVVGLGPAIVSIWYADGHLTEREPFLARVGVADLFGDFMAVG